MLTASPCSAQPVTVTAQVGAGGLLTDVALYLDVDQTQIVPASAPAPAPMPGNINGFGNTITNNNNNGPFQATPTAGGEPHHPLGYFIAPGSCV